MNNLFKVLTVGAIALTPVFVSNNHADAALITNVTASSTASYLAGSLSNITNGTNLSTPLSLSSTFAASEFNWAIEGMTATIVFNLNGTYNLDAFSYWTTDGGYAPYGIKGVTIETSLDGSNYTVLAGAPTSFNEGDISSTATENAQQVNLSTPVQASYVEFVVTSNYYEEGDITSVGAVEFDGTPVSSVPEPMSIAGTILAGGIGIVLKRQRVNQI